MCNKNYVTKKKLKKKNCLIRNFGQLTLYCDGWFFGASNAVADDVLVVVAGDNVVAAVDVVDDVATSVSDDVCQFLLCRDLGVIEASFAVAATTAVVAWRAAVVACAADLAAALDDAAVAELSEFRTDWSQSLNSRVCAIKKKIH